MKYINIIFTVILLITLSTCSNTKKWTVSSIMALDSIAPIGLTIVDSTIWLADGDNNRIVSISKSGNLVAVYPNFERPMHLSNHENTIFIPEYGADHIVQLHNGKRTVLSLNDSLDAPAGVAVLGKEIAIADFYNHSVLYFNGKQWQRFGKKGKKAGDFHYPTDVQITTNHIYVADAYNNRVQVLTKEGKCVKIIGENENINAATGLYVAKEQLFITDFENSRVLIFALETGDLQQIISDNLNKPTDVLQHEEILYIINYKSKNILLLNKN